MFNLQSVGGRICGRHAFAGASVAVLAVSFLAAAPALAQGSWQSELENAFRTGEFDLAFRYRFEFVDEDILSKDANASTLRTRLVYKSGEFKNVFLTLNMDDVRPIIGHDFNDTRNGKTQYPVVADPKGTDLNIAALTYTGFENASIVLGRQRIQRENVRFIGNVGWRQNEQTYDSLTGYYKPIDNLELFYSYVDRVRRIFGPEEGVPTSAFRSNSNLLDAAYTVSPLLRLFGYAYLLEFKNAASFSSRTFGIKATGSYRVGDGPNLTYHAEFGAQEDYKNNPVNYDTNYVFLNAGADWERFGAKLGFEVLEGDGTPGSSFQTPLATLHAMNGWADRFLVTPDAGLEDLSIEGNAKWLNGTWRLIYHKFSANSGGADWGDEIDISAGWKLGDRYTALVKLAFYDADQFSNDVTKFWVQFTADVF